MHPHWFGDHTACHPAGCPNALPAPTRRLFTTSEIRRNRRDSYERR